MMQRTYGPIKLIRELAVLLLCIWQHPANRGAKIAAITRFLAWQGAKRVLRRPIVLQVGSRRFVAYPDSPFSSLVIYNQLPDWDEMGFLKRMLQPNSTFLDIGANVGFYSVLAASWIGPAGSIISIEPNPANVRVLEDQKALNGLDYWRIVPCALGATLGEVDFNAPTRDTGSIQTGASITGARVRVPCTTLDALFDNSLDLGSDCIAKMDVEGYEGEVLRGAKGLLARRTVSAWIFENNPSSLRAHGTNSEALLTTFRSLGYEICSFCEDEAVLTVFNKPECLELRNFIACLDPEKLRDRLKR